MKEEQIHTVIDKLASAGVTLADLELIKPEIGSEDFSLTYEVISSLESAAAEDGRNRLRNEIADAAVKFHENETPETTAFSLKKIPAIYAMTAIAAVFLLICTLVITQQASSYNDVKNFSKRSSLIK